MDSKRHDWEMLLHPLKYIGVIEYSLKQSDGSPYSSGVVTIYMFTEGSIPRGMIIPETKEIGKNFFWNVSIKSRRSQCRVPWIRNPKTA